MVRGGIEYGFMSTTANREVAMTYAKGDGKSVGIVFEIKLGMIDRGADLEWLSQYPHEKEICMPPLTGLEVQGTYVDSSVLVVDVRLSVNLVSLTVEQVIAKRKQVVINMLENLKIELQAFMSRYNEEQTLLLKMIPKHPPLMDVVQKVFDKIKQTSATAFNDDEYFKK